MTAQDTSLAVRVGAISERGHRSENQDQMSGFSSSLGYVYLVADGMGGHQGGAQAAKMVIEGFRHYVMGAGAGTRLEDALQHAAASINTELLRRGQAGDPSLRHMGSTVVLMALRQTPFGNEFLVGHIGDSRAYLLRDGRLRLLTSDHSMVQRMVQEQILTAEAARNHPNANILTRAFGQQQDVALELSAPEPLQAGDVLMICSDGLWGYVPDEEIAHELSRSAQMEAVAANLVQLALNRGSDDNITVQAVRVESAGQPGASAAAAAAARPAGVRSTMVENAPSAGPPPAAPLPIAAAPAPAAVPVAAVAAGPPVSPSHHKLLGIIAITAVATAGACTGGYLVWQRHAVAVANKPASVSRPANPPGSTGTAPIRTAPTPPPITSTPMPPPAQPAFNQPAVPNHTPAVHSTAPVAQAGTNRPATEETPSEGKADAAALKTQQAKEAKERNKQIEEARRASRPEVPRAGNPAAQAEGAVSAPIERRPPGAQPSSAPKPASRVQAVEHGAAVAGQRAVGVIHRIGGHNSGSPQPGSPLDTQPQPQP